MSSLRRLSILSVVVLSTPQCTTEEFVLRRLDAALPDAEADSVVFCPDGDSPTVVVGSYEGDGASLRPVTGLPFSPVVVIIKSEGTTQAVLRSATLIGDLSKPLQDHLAAIAGLIVSLDPGGFTVGSDPRVNGLGESFQWVAFRPSADLALGSYDGTGVEQTVGGLPFTPEYLVVFAQENPRAVQRFSFSSRRTFPFSPGSGSLMGVRSFEESAFRVDTSAEVNELGNRYHYVAWRNASGSVRIGSYTGAVSGSTLDDDREITGLGFAPGYVLIKGDFDGEGVHRPSSLRGDFTLTFRGDPAFANRIQRFGLDGFQVGSHTSVNRPLSEFHFIAFSATPLSCLL